jgi:segregation and condensation protein B
MSGRITELSGPAARGRREALRIAEAMLFASATPLGAADLAARLPEGTDVGAVIRDLQGAYAGRGVNLVAVAGGWMFRTADDLSWLLQREAEQTRKLSRAALETLSIIAYHQPVTRAEIEEVRGVSISKGSLDLLMEIGWIRMRGRRKTPGRPVTYGTTAEFLAHFGLDTVSDLPGLEELRGAGLLEGHIPPGFKIPAPSDAEGLTDEEDPLGDEPVGEDDDGAAGEGDADRD